MNIDCCKSYVGKQIIGLLPSGPSECMWYWQSPDNAQLYTVNGYIISQINDINAELNPFGIYYNSYESYGGLYINFISIGLEAPTTAINILDENGNPVSYSWSSCCEKACYEITFNSGSEFIEYFDLGYGQPIWFDGVSFDQSILYDNFKYYYGSQITVTTDVTASSTYLKIENGYICGTPKVQTYNFAFTDMTVCAPPPPTCFYYSADIRDLSYGSFSDPAWDFGGFGNDFTAYALSFGGYVVQDGIKGVGSYDSSNSLQFFYLGTSVPPDLIIYNPNIGSNQTFTFSQTCTKECLSIPSYKYNNSPYGWIGIGSVILGANLLANYGGELDFNLGAASIEIILNNMLSKYQPQATAFVVDDGGGFFTITFQNFYSGYSGTNGAFMQYNFNLSTELLNTSLC